MGYDVDVRDYHQFCGVAKALDVVGERWTLLIVRDLLLGGRRYSDLLAGLPGLTTNLLAKRLQAMEAAGLVVRRQLTVPGRAVVYELTDRGRELEAVVLALGRFGEAYLDAPEAEDRLDVRWAMLSLKRRYVGTNEALSAELGFLLPEASRHFAVQLRPASVEVRDGSLEGAALRLRFVGIAGLPRWFSRSSKLLELVDEGLVELEGRRRDLTRFSRAFGFR